MTEVRDPVHGYVKLEGLALEIANTPQMQRLRWIKQLGLANLVYPGANHTRFEHSLGAYHMAFLLTDHLGLDEDDRTAGRLRWRHYAQRGYAIARHDAGTA